MIDVMTKKNLAAAFGISESTVQHRVRDIEKEIAAGRYGQHALCVDGRILLINPYVFYDYICNRQALMNKNARKTVPPFDIDEVRKYLGNPYEGGEEYEIDED